MSSKESIYMLEKIGAPGFHTISKPDEMVLQKLSSILKKNSSPIIYEIGVGIGATTLPVAEMMNGNGEIFLFSREKDIIELASDLRQRGYLNINSSWGSPGNTYSGYHFELARGMIAGDLPKFDLAYIDGGHVFHLDAPTACILKELCKPGGVMIFDDYYWSLEKSPTMNPNKRPETAKEYDWRQIEACHVELVCKLFMDTDSRYKFSGLHGNTVIYENVDHPPEN